MVKTTKEFKSCTEKRTLTILTLNVTYIFETVWTAGVSVAAAMFTSVPIKSRRAH